MDRAKAKVYKTAKLFHLTGLILWLGPSTGGYLLLLLSRHRHEQTTGLWLFKEYINLIHIEALGLAVLISSGLTMRSASPELKKAGWLKIKLFIVFSVFVPLELIQLYIYERVVKNAFLTGTGIEDSISLYGTFSRVSFIFLAIAVPAVFFLAVFRPEVLKGGKK